MIIPKMYDIEITSSDYNPDIDTSLTITATATDYNGNPVVGETLTIKHNGTTVGTPRTNSNGVATVTTTCGSAGTHQFTCKSASCVISVNPYPVGSIFTSVDSTSPETLFGGLWTQLTDTFLYASTTADDDATTAPSGQGETTHTLTISEMPSHNHTQAQHRHIEQGKYSDGSGSAGAYTYSSNRKAVDHYTGYATPTINNTGGGAAHNNMPPYIKVYMWKRMS